MAAESEVSIQTALRQVKRKRHFNIEILPALTLGGPAFFLLLMFLIGPFFLGIWYSFTDQRLISPKPAEFVGLRNYERMLKLSLLTLDPLVDEETGEYQRDETGNLEFPRSRQYTRDEENYPQYAGLREWFKVDVGNRRYVVLAGDPDFYRSLRNIFMFAIVVIPLQSGLGLVLALLVNQKLAGKNFFRTIYFSPVVTSMVVISIVWTFLYDYHNGMVNQFLSSFSLGPVNWLGDPKIAMWAIIIMSVWQGVGFQMVLWLAGLQGIPEVLSWRHLPIALYPDEVGNIFSGSAVIDWKDTAGFGAEAMVAIFTHESQGRQMQSLAYSTDQGRTWHKYDANPVLDPPNNIKNFRDPKVLWYDAGDGAGHWVMSVAAGNVILFYSSPDMKNWEPTGGFGLGYSATCGVWETPDLFELPVDGGPETRWVLAVGIGGCAPGGGSGVQYFIGAFDGATFSSENPQETVLWADYGADFYAAQSWSDAPGGRRIWVGWMNNWLYAQDIPTSSWRGALTIPRELALTNTPQGVRLVQRPVPELQQLRGEHWEWEAETITGDAALLDEVSGETLEISAKFQVDATTTADRIGLRVRSGDGEYTSIGYASKGRVLFVDRTESGQVDFNPGFPGVHTAQMEPDGDAVRLHIFLDRSSVEVFGNDGQVVLTERIFPDAESLGLELFADGGSVVLNGLDIYQLDAATFLRVEKKQADEN